MLLNLKSGLAIALLLILSNLGSVYYGHTWGYESCQRDTEAAEAREDRLVDRMESSVAKALGTIKVTHTTVRQEVEREVLEKPVYRDCVHDPDVLRLINEALAPGMPAGAGGMPGAGASDGSEFQGDDAEAGGRGPAVPVVPEGGVGLLRAWGTG